VSSCPRCGCKQTIMVLVRTDPTGIKIRRRKCKHCDHRYYTAQSPEEVISKYQIKWSGSSSTHNEMVTFKGACERISGLGDSGS
jgi:transcriptional regulator NrdR family protein